MTKKALLLGAGFSYDLGMPLASSFTDDFFYFLTPERLSRCIKIWREADPYGPDRQIDPLAIDEVFDIYERSRGDGSNYEGFLKSLQNEYHRLGASQPWRDSFHYAFGRIFEIVVRMFWKYQVHNFGWYLANRHLYDSFSRIVPSDEELWVVSLNHDLFIEFLCLKAGIPLSFGSTTSILIPESNQNMKKQVLFSAVDRKNMNLTDMDFLRNQRGVNLIKLHGGINEFTFDDDSKVLQVALGTGDTELSYLMKTSCVLNDFGYFVNGSRVRIHGEIAISNMQGEMGFLRHSILTGGYKYSETFDPKPGEEKIRLMDEVFGIVEEITIIGYGFADEHVNLRLYNAMLMNPDLSLVIVNPGILEIPPILKPFNYKQRVRLAKCGCPEWLSYLDNGSWDSELMITLEVTRANRKAMDEQYRQRILSTGS
ncbi:hypothetical protein [Alicyclobacillus acidiphilus]|uniref:hypothetical protein n=1 Tax=Alicyclobacillus acidiphilus TaxID=182455 RepID=UPI00083762EC|nr:hypothetical protein [Alicyclobacillus acidiphilus]